MIPIKNRKNLEERIEEVRNFAHAYLEKYSSSKQQLRTYLLKRILKKPKQIKNNSELLNLIDIVISDLESKKFLNDGFYSDIKSKAYLKKGFSLNKIRHTLIKKGINAKYITESISKIKNNESDPDFFSAIKLCKKRRIGAIREEGNRKIFYKKDIGILARSGFSYEISKKILDIPKEEFKKLCKLL